MPTTANPPGPSSPSSNSSAPAQAPAAPATPPQAAPAPVTTPAPLLTESGRRLARVIYAAELVSGRRVLEIGGDAHSAVLLAQRGARAVMTLAWDSAAKAPTEPRHERVLIRVADRAGLLRAGGLSEALRGGSGGPFQSDVIFLSADRALLSAPGLLGDLRRVLVKDGQLIVSVASKEASPGDDAAVSYFDLLDALERAGFGPVAMLGQSPFFAAAVMPFGAASPALVLDDTLAPAAAPDEYVALCGTLPAKLGPELPYEVVKLPASALRKPAPVAPPAPPAPIERIVEKTVEVVRPDAKVVQERDELRGELDALRREHDRVRARLGEVETGAAQWQQGAATAHQNLEAELNKTTAELRKLESSYQSLRIDHLKAETQRAELSERQRLRDRTESEHVEAALLHERQMRELRTALEERDAFVAELEEQARERPQLEERLRVAEQRAEQRDKAERTSRQRLAEVEGQLLRARKELEERATQADLPGALETQRRDVEAQRREALVQRAELEKEVTTLRGRKSELERAEQALAKQKEQFGQLETVVTRQLGQQKEQLERTEQAKRTEQARAHAEAIAARDASLIAAERKLAQVEQQLDRLRSEVRQKDQALAERDAGLAEKAAALAAAERKLATAADNATKLGSRTATATATALDEGVPMAVGDQPTAPVALSAAAATASPHEELRSLRKRTTELEAENLSLKDKVTESERETWKHMKARSEAEQAAAEVREDTVRKLRDARKLASVELTRAMEDATKKAVSLREELSRTEAERKEALAQIKDLRAARDTALQQVSGLRQEIDSLRWTDGHEAGAESAGTYGQAEEAAVLQGARSETERALVEERNARQAAQQAADEAQSRVAELRASVVGLEQALGEAREQISREQERVEALEEEVRGSGGSIGGSAASLELLQLQQELLQRERSVIDLRAERESLGRLLAEVEREAYARAERARQLRVRLSERERELDALRVELSDRERQLGALTALTPQSEELARVQGELHSARRRIADLLEEAALKEQASDEAVATALRERARSTRAGESITQITRERDEARDDAKLRVGEIEQRLSEVLSESNRLRAELLRLGGSVPSATSMDTPTGSGPQAADPVRPLTADAVQRVKAAGQALGLEPVYLAQSDEAGATAGEAEGGSQPAGTPPAGTDHEA